MQTQSEACWQDSRQVSSSQPPTYLTILTLQRMRCRLHSQPGANVPRHRTLPRRDGILQDDLRRARPKAKPRPKRQRSLRLVVAHLSHDPHYHPLRNQIRHRQVRSPLQIQALRPQTRTQTRPRPLPTQGQIPKGQQGTRSILLPSHRPAPLQRQASLRTHRLQLPQGSHWSTCVSHSSPPLLV